MKVQILCQAFIQVPNCRLCPGVRKPPPRLLILFLSLPCSSIPPPHILYLFIWMVGRWGH